TVGPVDIVKLLPVVLGKGAFGRVYEGTYRGQRVAVKQVVDLSEGATLEDLQASFAQELEVLGRCEHPNILRILAACLTPPRPCLVMELMDTSLDKMLHGRLLPLPLVLHIASEIALGLAYLHPTILHRDLKPANVLINSPWGEQPTAVKLSDFGLSRLRNTALVTECPEAGTVSVHNVHGTAPPGRYKITYQSDIYSYGVVLWEMLAGCRPWDGIGTVGIACQITLLGKRLGVPPSATPGSCPSRWPPQLCELLNECWDKDPERRPAAAELAKRLLLLKQKLQGGASTDAGSQLTC
ncbi:putative serine/threonine-protein kinase, partial [Tetrabaena socialis]